MTFEYLCVNPLNGQVAATQVKTGNTALNKDDYSQFQQIVFLFQANEIYAGSGSDNVKAIPRNHLLEFLKKSFPWLPRSFKRKMEIANLV